MPETKGVQAESTAVPVAEDPKKCSSARPLEATEEAAHLIVERLGSDLDRLAELLERADPQHLVRTILSCACEQRDAERDRSAGELHAKGQHGARPEILPTEKGENGGPGEAASAAPVPLAVTNAQSTAADQGSAGRTTPAPSSGGQGGTKSAHDDFPDIPDCLRRTPLTPLCMQPADEAPAQNAADTLTGESIPSSEPVQRRETAADTN